MKGNRKPLVVLLVFIIIFASFIWIITRVGDDQIAINEVKKINDIESLKEVWHKNDNLSTKQKEKLSKAIREKVSTINANDDEIANVFSWLPPNTNNLNIIIIPDLSVRTADAKSQIDYDTTLISYIWNSFENSTKRKTKSKDRFVVQVTDECQAQGEFKNFADNLVFDVSESKEANTSLYFSKNRSRLNRNLKGLYRVAENLPPVANNFIPYFNNRLVHHLKKSTLEDRYRNIVFILTDGYMEEMNCNRTAKLNEWTPIQNLNSFASNRDNITFKYPTMGSKFPELEVYVFEIDSHSNHEDGIKHWWESWLKSMDIKASADSNIFPHTPSKSQWKSKIENIIKG
jgi:hypothetical protein